MPGIFDTHAHYDADAFDADRDALLAALPGRGVCGVINAATDIASAEESLRLSRRYPYLRVAVGIHPEAVADAAPAQLEAVRRLAGEPAVCAIGEIGLDYHWEDGAPRAVQLDWCRRHIELALTLDLTVIFHSRDAHEDTLALMREYRPRGVLHCYSGSVEMLREVMDLGLYIGLGGAVTFANARRPVAVAAEVPLERLLLETDAPYMAPVPCRGQRCDSAMIEHTAARIALLRGISTAALLDATRANANTLFGLNL